MPQLAFNKKATYDYEILDKFEAGLKLTGQEVKAVRAGRMSITGSFVVIRGGHLDLLNAHIQKFSQAGPLPGYDPDHTRTLLMHKREIQKLAGKLDQKGLTLVPLSVYTKGSIIKLEFCLGRGKKQYQKKETIKKRDLDREMRGNMKRW